MEPLKQTVNSVYAKQDRKYVAYCNLWKDIVIF